MTTTTESSLVFVVTSPSAMSYRQCLLGHGATKAEALANAFGPKPWGPHSARSARSADCYEVTQNELEELQFASASQH